MRAEQWVNAVIGIIRVLTGHPRSSIEMSVALGAAWLTLVLALSASGRLLGFSQYGRSRSAVAATLGIILVVAGMAAARLYLPQWNHEGWRLWILAVSGILVSLVLVIPVVGWLHKGGYFGALFSWICGILAAALVIMLVGAIFDAMAAGARSMDKGTFHREQVERALE